jgi:hypothetical protein
VNEIVRLRRDLPCYSDYKDSELTVVCSRVHTESFDAQPKRVLRCRVYFHMYKIPPEHIEARGLGFLDLKKRGVGQTYGTSEHKRRKTQPIPPEKPPHVVQPPGQAFVVRGDIIPLHHYKPIGPHWVQSAQCNDLACGGDTVHRHIGQGPKPVPQGVAGGARSADADDFARHLPNRPRQRGPRNLQALAQCVAGKRTSR